MNRTFLSRTPLYDRDQGSQPARATTRVIGQRFTLADTNSTVPSSPIASRSARANAVRAEKGAAKALRGSGPAAELLPVQSPIPTLFRYRGAAQSRHPEASVRTRCAG